MVALAVVAVSAAWLLTHWDRDDADERGYALLKTQPDSDSPVGFNPCEPIEYVVFNRSLAPSNSGGLIDGAIRAVERASGLKFVYKGQLAGTVRRPPSTDGSRISPVMIGWATGDFVTGLNDTVLGLGGSHDAWNPEHAAFEYVDGAAVIDAKDAAWVLAGANGRRIMHAVFVHELGHVLGLDHAPDREAVMYESQHGQTELSAGDLAGFAAVGAGRCPAARAAR